MAAQLDVLAEGYAQDRVASTVVLVRDGDTVIVVDPGMVASREVILAPLAALGVDVADVTDVVLSHHHPDHTINVALFPRARVHDFQATYLGDVWEDADADRALSPHVALMATPGHTDQDVSTLVSTADGLVVCTHLWWSADGPAEDPFAPDADRLAASRRAVLDLSPALVLPGHGAGFVPGPDTPR